MLNLYSDSVFDTFSVCGHFENAERIRGAADIVTAFLGSRCFRSSSSRPATLRELTLVHSEQYLETLGKLSAAEGVTYLCPETPVGPGALQMAMSAAGAVLQAVDDILAATSVTKAFCIVRPPGHHACVGRGMGSCILNNVALGASYATKVHSLKRVLIVDWDLHHPNGTQDIFYEDPSVYLFSIHKHRTWHYEGESGVGAVEETGAGAGRQTVFNFPVARSVSRSEYIERFEATLKLAADSAEPELLLISAGFDTHKLDTFGDLCGGLETDDFRVLTRLVCEAGRRYCDGRIISVLEGGYNRSALLASILAHVDELA